MGPMLAAFVLSLLIVLFLGPATIGFLRRLKARQTVRQEGPTSHYQKTGTPTMGGVLMLLATSLATILLAPDLTRAAVLLMVMLGYGLVGITDDFLKAVYHRSLGIRARVKFLWQVVLGFLPAFWVLQEQGAHALAILVPFSGQEWVLPIWLYLPFSLLVVVGASNAVNLTDGLDGLAAGTSAIGALALGVLLGERHEPTGAVFAFALAGACVGFLWFNGYPARVFMGDTGSLALGGALGSLAVLGGLPLYLALIGGIFVVETLSVMIQVFTFKTFHRRVFRMTPIHHHFELAGRPEPVVVVRFWIVAVLFAVTGLLAYYGFGR